MKTAAVLKTTVGAVKSALHRGRGRMSEAPRTSHITAPERALVEAFLQALAARDLATLDGVEGINEIHRIEAHAGVITRVRLYCFCPDVLRSVAEQRGVPVVGRPIAYRTSVGAGPGL